MSFVNRAEISYKKGDVISTVITLIEGVKKNPDHAQAFRWMIDLYCDEVENIGLEEDIVVVIDSCEDPEEVYAWIYKRLQRSGKQEFIKKLDRARRQSAGAYGKTVVPLEDLTQLREQSSKQEDVNTQQTHHPSETTDTLLNERTFLQNRILANEKFIELSTNKEKLNFVERREYFSKEDKDSLDYYSQDTSWPTSGKVENTIDRDSRKNKKINVHKKRNLIVILITFFVLISLMTTLYYYVF